MQKDVRLVQEDGPSQELFTEQRITVLARIMDRLLGMMIERYGEDIAHQRGG
jgi:hypothetical protein